MSQGNEYLVVNAIEYLSLLLPELLDPGSGNNSHYLAALKSDMYCIPM